MVNILVMFHFSMGQRGGGWLKGALRAPARLAEESAAPFAADACDGVPSTRHASPARGAPGALSKFSTLAETEGESAAFSTERRRVLRGVDEGLCVRGALARRGLCYFARNTSTHCWSSTPPRRST